MIPTTSTILDDELEIVNSPDVQHKMLIDKERIAAKVDGIEAVKQTIYKILNTERYDYMIYSWNYGIELIDLFGKSPNYAIPEIERRIKDALLVDDRITSVDSFEFKQNGKGVISVTFTAHTIYGDTTEGLEVQ